MNAKMIDVTPEMREQILRNAIKEERRRNAYLKAELAKREAAERGREAKKVAKGRFPTLVAALRKAGL